MSKPRLRFLVSYAGEVEFEYKGERYEVRHRSFPGPWADYDGTIVPWVGTVRVGYRPGPLGRNQFPPDDLLALVPGYVGAKYDPEAKTIEYHPGPPQVVRDGDDYHAVAPLPPMS
jgi:hypothetical protein